MKNTLWTRDYSLLIGATVLGAAGGIIGNTGAQQIKLPLLLVLADQVGQQRLHRAALHRGDRQIRRRHQQHAGTSFLV